MLFKFYPSFPRHSVNGFLAVRTSGTENAFQGRRINTQSLLLAGKAAHYLLVLCLAHCSGLQLCPEVCTQEVPCWIPREEKNHPCGTAGTPSQSFTKSCQSMLNVWRAFSSSTGDSYSSHPGFVEFCLTFNFLINAVLVLLPCHTILTSWFNLV